MNKKIIKILFVGALMIAAIMLASAGDIVFEDGGMNVTDDLQVDSDTLFVDSTNNMVGIGTTSPSSTLEVDGDIEVGDDDWIGIGSSDERIVFDSDGNDIEIMGGGYVGINTDSPDGLLHLANAGNTNLYVDLYRASNNWLPRVYLRRSHNDTQDQTTTTIDEDYLGALRADGVDSGGNFDTGGQLIFRQDGTAAGEVPTKLTINLADHDSLNSPFVLDSSGNLTITGDLSKGSGTFTIDHPLDPTNKVLQHSFVESPEMRNIYYGQAETLNGEVEISLSDWWQALNGDDKSEYNYQFTPIGKWCNLYVSQEITHNKFKVASDVDCKFSWTVSGIRHDAYAEANRIQVEKYKLIEDLNIEYDEEVIDGKLCQVPVMPSVSSRRKGACIHEEACANVDAEDLIAYPEEPQTVCSS